MFSFFARSHAASISPKSCSIAFSAYRVPAISLVSPASMAGIPRSSILPIRQSIHCISSVLPLGMPDSTDAPEPKMKQNRSLLSDSSFIICDNRFAEIILDSGNPTLFASVFILSFADTVRMICAWQFSYTENQERIPAFRLIERMILRIPAQRVKSVKISTIFP